VPLLMPLVTLMERQAVAFEGTDMWEKNDQSCEIMLNHLATARSMASAADSYRTSAERTLAGGSGVPGGSGVLSRALPRAGWEWKRTDAWLLRARQRRGEERLGNPFPV
jgi:hypothetical protein